MMPTNSGKYYVSVTGLVTKSFLSTLKFYYYTTPAFRAAESSEGIISASGTSYKSVYMTVMLWESKEDMRKYFRGEAHIAAMKQLKDVSRYGKIHGYFTDKLPSNTEAIEMWKKEGRIIHGELSNLYGDILKS